MSGSERYNQAGIFSSFTFFTKTGTPAFRKYFWAIISAATCE
jgi:hypothetical protein